MCPIPFINYLLAVQKKLWLTDRDFLGSGRYFLKITQSIIRHVKVGPENQVAYVRPSSRASCMLLSSYIHNRYNGGVHTVVYPELWNKLYFPDFRTFPDFWENIHPAAGLARNVIKSKDRDDTGLLKRREPLEPTRLEHPRGIASERLCIAEWKVMHTTTTNELFLVGFLSFVIAQHAYTTVKSKMVKILMGSSEVAFFKEQREAASLSLK